MRYKSKKLILSWVKIGLILSAFLMLATPHETIARIAGVVAIFLFFTHIFIRHLMRKHFQKETKAESDPEYLFEWLVVGWVGTLFGLFIPGFLYSQNLINTKTLHRVFLGEFAFLILYSLVSFLRSFLHQRRKTAENIKRLQPGELASKPRDPP